MNVAPNDVLSALSSHLKTVSARIKPSEQLRIFCAGDFGTTQVFQVTAHDDRYLYIRAGEPAREIIALPERCSFMFVVEPRKGNEPDEPRVILGFSA